MSARPSTPARSAVLASLILFGCAAPTLAYGEAPSRLTVLERALTQDQGGWRVDYQIRYDGLTGIIVTPSDITFKVEGWVSNSRVASHAVPRWSSVAISGSSGLSSCCDVIASSDDELQCRERVVVQMWTGDEAPAEPAKAGTRTASSEPAPILSLAPGSTVRVRVRLEHQHFLFGDYDPLLGNRTAELRLATAVLQDTLPMEREQYLAMPKYTWPAPPEDKRDTQLFMSKPDSLHLEAHVPGNQNYHFPEHPVRYATPMRLRFWYMVAPGSEDECRARIVQYKDNRAIPDGGQEFCLKTVGRWTKVERYFRTESEASSLALEFRICGGTDIGEVWIDDVSLEPVVTTTAGP